MNDTKTQARITVTLTRGDHVRQMQWDDFCKAAGLELQEDGWFLGAGLRASCERGTATFTGPEAVGVAVAFWLQLGGQLRADSPMDDAIGAALRDRPCMTSAGIIPLVSFGWVHRIQDWGAWTRTDIVPLRALAGLTVNLGTKDGVVYEGATVSSFDRNKGELYLTGGVFGHSYRNDDAIPLVTGACLHANDIARGYIHLAVTS